jgi:hypothetical protein
MFHIMYGALSIPSFPFKLHEIAVLSDMKQYEEYNNNKIIKDRSG